MILSAVEPKVLGLSLIEHHLLVAAVRQLLAEVNPLRRLANVLRVHHLAMPEDDANALVAQLRDSVFPERAHLVYLAILPDQAKVLSDLLLSLDIGRTWRDYQVQAAKAGRKDARWRALPEGEHSRIWAELEDRLDRVWDGRP